MEEDCLTMARWSIQKDLGSKHSSIGRPIQQALAFAKRGIGCKIPSVGALNAA
jgi:hypothetical protein